MRFFLAHHPTSHEIIALNRCRPFLQVYILSEIFTGEGYALSEDAPKTLLMA